MSIKIVDREVCGGCGVYRSLHPTNYCEKPTASWWWKRHYLHRHVGNWLWIHALTSKMRWRIASQFEHRTNWHWCDLVDACTKADDSLWHSDYRHPNGCLCDFTSPWDARAPRVAGARAPRGCGYCQPRSA